MTKQTVIVGILGSKLDQNPPRGDRWKAWRPSVAVCQQEDLIVDRFELLYESKSQAILDQVTADIEAISPETEIRPTLANYRDPWDFEEVYATLHDFATNTKFDVDQEDYLVHITTGSHVAQICLFLLTESRHLPGKLLQTSPPRRRGNRGSKGSYRVIDLDLSRYDALASRFHAEKQEGVSFLKSGIDTRSQRFNELIDRIEVVSLATTAPILLTGPTGAGKTQLAKRIYELRRHRDLVTGDLVSVNCATIRGEQSMSTLFGHVKGAFTGAATNRAGLLKSADGGVLFLDEVGELGLDEQAMLLRAIEEKHFMPVGSDQLVASDFQLLAGTNRNLMEDVAAGKFREDLLARINLWCFELPGLADRREDITPNLDFELQQFTSQHGRKVTMNKEARDLFLQFARDPSTPWAANFRDLNAAVVRMATLATSGRITVANVNEEIERLKQGWGTRLATTSADELTSFFTADQIEGIDQFDRVQLAEAIRVCQESKSLSDAGRALFQASRKAKAKPNDSDRLRKYLAKFGLKWSDVQT